MLIAGFQKTSFVDYPGQPACVVFTPYCNLNCIYCHNAQILEKNTPLIDEDSIIDYLVKRHSLIHALVISGGEPTLQQNLEAFIREAKELGYKIKLDTNGTKPGVLRELLQKQLLDYVAMDIKAPLYRYEDIARVKVDTDAILRSITLLRNGDVAHEFRLTFCPQLTPDEAVEAAMLVKGCTRFYLQQYRVRKGDDPPPHAPSLLRETGKRIQDAIGVCQLRGIGTEEGA
jgi:pyruvate formate lyase activating enzyme